MANTQDETKALISGLNPRVYKLKHKANRFLGVPTLKPNDVHLSETSPQRPTIRQAFLDVNMINRHFGMADIARKGGIDVTTLKKREFVMFINPERSTIALFGYGGTLTYINKKYSKSLGVKLLAEDVLEEIGELYSSEGWACDAKLKQFLMGYLPKRKEKTVVETSAS